MVFLRVIAILTSILQDSTHAHTHADLVLRVLFIFVPLLVARIQVGFDYSIVVLHGVLFEHGA